MSDFWVGDIIRPRPNASERYGITNQERHWAGRIVCLLDDAHAAFFFDEGTMISAETIHLDERYYTHEEVIAKGGLTFNLSWNYFERLNAFHIGEYGIAEIDCKEDGIVYKINGEWVSEATVLERKYCRMAAEALPPPPKKLSTTEKIIAEIRKIFSKKAE